MKEKIALFCDVDVEAVVTARRRGERVRMSLVFAEQGVDEIALRLLRSGRHGGPRDLTRWTEMVGRLKNPTQQVSIGLVGKYVEYEDSYKSLKEALLHGGLAHDAKVNITWIESERLKWPDAIAELERSTESWCRADSEGAAWKECCAPFATRANARFRTSESAWACRPW